jgi:cyclopropane fatty-acyl-phospholipid synthase-like methyltransferase
VLDYGCGKGYLAKEIPFPIWEYDPAIPGKDATPRAADLVACLDVLEHIEPELLDFVLDDIRRCVKQIGYFVIHTGPSSKTLADGRNAHLIQQTATWWGERLQQFFTVAKVIENGPLLHVIVAPKKKGKAKRAKVSTIRGAA